MASESTTSSVEDLFNCTVCFYKYDSDRRKAKLLPCHHTFCSQCLSSMILSSLLRCPLCGEVTCVTNVNTLKNNHYLAQFSDVLQQVNKLSISQPPSTPSHKPPDTIDEFCSKHGNMQKFFWCWTCSCTICVNCTALDHKTDKGHEVCNISDAVEEIRRMLLKTLSTIHSMRSIIRDKQSEVESLHNTKTELTISALCNVTSAPKEDLKIVTEKALNPKNFTERFDAASDFLNQPVAKLHRCHLELQEISSYMSNLEIYVDQKLEEARVRQDSEILVTFLHPKTRFDYGRMYCMRCGKMCQVQEALPPGKANPYGVPVVLNHCTECAITILKISEMDTK